MKRLRIIQLMGLACVTLGLGGFSSPDCTFSISAPKLEHKAKDLDAGAFHSCAIVDGGSVKCWGHNEAGQLGDGTELPRQSAVKASGLANVTSLGLGGFHSCAVDSGKAKCWGANYRGELGDGTTSSSSVAVTVAGLTAVIDVDAGLWSQQMYDYEDDEYAPGSHSCAVIEGGSVYCWGYNGYGQLGDGTTQDSATPVNVLGINNAVGVSLGLRHSCAILENNDIKCWGSNTRKHYFDCCCGNPCVEHFRGGQLGDGSTADSPYPVNVANVSNAAALSVGAWHSCALLEGGSITCWGDGEYGQLGNGTHSYSTSPTPAGQSAPAAEIASGEYHVCAVLEGGSIECWGNNFEYALGNDLGGYALSPVRKPGLTKAAQKAAGGYTHTCAVVDGGSILCWGNNLLNQLGAATDPAVIRTPTTVLPPSGVASISAGFDHNCALLDGGSVLCWGWGKKAQLGDGVTVSSHTPITPSGLGPAIDASAGMIHACAVLDSGSVACWGPNYLGVLGDGDTAAPATKTPVFVSGLSDAYQVSAGFMHSCALMDGGSVLCWGSNRNGQLGNGRSGGYELYEWPWGYYYYASNIPVIPTGLPAAIDVDAGITHTCAVLAGGSVACWGSDWGYKVSSTSTCDVKKPCILSSIENASRVAAGYFHSCALLEGGSVFCWGYNNWGQLGNGETSYNWEDYWWGDYSSPDPQAVVGISGAVDIDAGLNHTCALMGDSTVRCWGQNAEGQTSPSGEGVQLLDIVSTPVEIGGVEGAVSISAGEFHACAAISDGSVKCWGHSSKYLFGQAEPAAAFSIEPVAVSGLNP